MDVSLHKRCVKFIYVIPEGLRELMSDISREVLCSQPEHIYTFVADYLDALMITRENARVAAKLVESITEIGTTVVELLQRTGMSREQVEKMAAIIQNAFRKYIATKNHQLHVEFTTQEEEQDEICIVSEILNEYGMYCEDEKTAAKIIQKAFRNFRKRHIREKDLLTGVIDWRVAARSAIYLYRKSRVTNEEANRAATLIKAAYKGYYTRRVMQRLVDGERKIYEVEKVEQIEEEYKTELSEHQVEFTTEKITKEDSELKLMDSRQLAQNFVDIIVCKAVSGDLGTFSRSSSNSISNKHGIVNATLKLKSEEYVKSTEEKTQTSEIIAITENTVTEEAGIQENTFLSLESEGSEQETEQPKVISEPPISKLGTTEELSRAEIIEETITESLTQITSKDFTEEDEADQTFGTDTSEFTEATYPPTETT